VDTYDYDLARRLIEHEDALGRITQFEYDTLSRLIETTLADADAGGALASPVYQTAYDHLGRVTQTTDPLGNITKNTFLRFGREVRTQLPHPSSSGVLANVYDSIVHLTPLGEAKTIRTATEATTSYFVGTSSVNLRRNGFGDAWWETSAGSNSCNPRSCTTSWAASGGSARSRWKRPSTSTTTATGSSPSTASPPQPRRLIRRSNMPITTRAS
jgi:YD repeat-containing protein